MADSREKKPFNSCVQRVGEDALHQLVCLEDRGEPIIQPEAKWIISQCADRDSLRTDDFGHSLGLNKVEMSAAKRAAPRDKEQQMRQAVIRWSRNERDEATLEKLLEALYIRDEVELVEGICQSLSQTRISEDRKIHGGPDLSTTLLNSVLVQAGQYKEEQEEVVISPSSVKPENVMSFKEPIRATSSGSHDAMVLMSAPIPETLLHSKKAYIQELSSNAAAGPAIPEENSTLKNSVAAPNYSKPSLEARIEEMDDRLTSEIGKMKENFQVDFTNLKEEIKELKKKLREKQTEIKDLQDELKLTGKQLTDEAAKRQNAEKQRDSEKQGRKEAERLNVVLQKEVDELRKELRMKEEQLRQQQEKASENSMRSQEQVDGTNASSIQTPKNALCLQPDRPLKSMTISKYGECLGRGCYGSVHVVEVKGGKQPYAGKKFKDTCQEKCLSEMTTLQHLKHDNIVQYVGWSWHKGDMVIIMEKMDSSLSDRLYHRDFKFTRTQELNILYDVTNGLDYLHTRDPLVIHRDLTANNVLLDRYLRAKIADFSNSKIVTIEERLTLYPGTRAYSAPEVADGDYDQKCDIFSFAHLTLCTLSKLPCDKLARSREERDGRLVALTEVDRRSLYFGNLRNDRALLDKLMIERCLDFEPAKRPSAAELKEILSSEAGACSRSSSSESDHSDIL